jgi:hypothetical protein
LQRDVRKMVRFFGYSVFVLYQLRKSRIFLVRLKKWVFVVLILTLKAFIFWFISQS